MTGGAQDSGALLPCPFCGTGPSTDEHAKQVQAYRQMTDGSYSVWCEGCGAEGSHHRNREEAITAWNTRATPAPAGWMPIESAPKDGTWFWGFWPTEIIEDQQQTTSYIDEDGGYFINAADSMEHHQPTFWRELPTAPAEGGDHG